MHGIRKFVLIILLLSFILKVQGQISPGELAEPHANLEGISNCTQCHELGEKVSDAKCLACHKEVKSRIDQKKGFHSSPEVSSKSCTVCHNDHHGRKFEIVHFDQHKFDHQTTGFALEGKHKEKQCADCHKPENIKDASIKKKKMSYLGLDPKCLACHKDYHQQTLSSDCAACHHFESFKTATKFNHKTTRFPLKGKHAGVTCLKCHPKEKRNEQDFQRFSGIEFSNCTACHKDVHENKFGNDCRKCHSEESFHQISGIKTFDHSKTDFKLKGKHQTVECKACHKGSYTSPIKYSLCMNCHKDYHNGQFTSQNKNSDCKDCHNENSFKSTSYSTDQHNKSDFRLEGAHLATPCFSCHKTSAEWKFRFQDKKCISCHENIHQGKMDEKYIPDGQCDKCHGVSGWNAVTFDHRITNFELFGKHSEKSCRDCHYKKGEDNQSVQVFSGLKPDCESCHSDVHQKQFSTNGKTDCTKCHGFENWKADRFNHDLTRFKLDGGHRGVDCKKCHLQNNSATIPFIQYKNTDRQCKSCHI